MNIREARARRPLCALAWLPGHGDAPLSIVISNRDKASSIMEAAVRSAR